MTFLAIVVGALGVLLVGVIGWLTWLERMELESDDWCSDDELADWWDELADRAEDDE